MAIDSFEIGVAGVTFEGRQDVLRQLHEQQEMGSAIAGSIERDRENSYDRNAIRVVFASPATGTATVGYVPRALAASLAPRLDAGEIPLVSAARVICGQYDRITYGARLQVEMQPKEAVS